MVFQDAQGVDKRGKRKVRTPYKKPGVNVFWFLFGCCIFNLRHPNLVEIGKGVECLGRELFTTVATGYYKALGLGCLHGPRVIRTLLSYSCIHTYRESV